jgi:hypothetical protein
MFNACEADHVKLGWGLLNIMLDLGIYAGKNVPVRQLLPTPPVIPKISVSHGSTSF